jgi:DNA-binding CsgD family transcriptional regulator
VVEFFYDHVNDITSAAEYVHDVLSENSGRTSFCFTRVIFTFGVLAEGSRPDSCVAFRQNVNIKVMASLLWLFAISFGIALANLAVCLRFVLRDARWLSRTGVIWLGACSLFTAFFNCGFFIAWLSGDGPGGTLTAGDGWIPVLAAGLALLVAVACVITAVKARNSVKQRLTAGTFAVIHVFLAVSLVLTRHSPLFSMAIVNTCFMAASVVNMIRAILANREAKHSSREADPLSDSFPAISDHVVEISGLSDREREIVSLLNQGLASKEIAYQLKIKTLTVKNHVYNIYQKTGVKNRVELLNLFRQSPGTQIGKDD